MIRTKVVAMLLILAMLFVGVSAVAENAGETWHCDNCDTDLDTDFCPICGNERPVAEEEAEPEEAGDPENTVDTWTCPVCGEVLPLEYNFCPNDRTVKAVSSGAWPVRAFEGITASMNSRGKNVKEQAYLGPGKNYAQGGTFYPGTIHNMTALLKDGGFILVDMEYASTGKRCVYFKSSAISDSPEAVNMVAYPAITTADVQPMLGPGNDYDTVKRTVVRNHKKNDGGASGGDGSVSGAGDNTLGTGNTVTYTTIHSNDIVLSANTTIDVFFESNGWVFAEFESNAGTIRAWIPADMVSSK